MTLKEFADRNGINYQTAKTWLRRGRIVSEGEGFKLAEVKPGETVEVSLERGERLKPYVDFLNPAETLKPETVTVRDYDPETVTRADCDPRTKTEIALQARVETCERDIAALQRFIDGLRDRVAVLESLLRQSDKENVRLVGWLEKLQERVDVDTATPSPQLGKPKNGIIDPPSSGWGA